MELQFHKTKMTCLQQILEEIKDQELTQEVKLSEGMPDIGNVLGTWGQVLIRSKEWNSNRIGVSGGVMVCVLYAPEDGSEPRMVEAWIPFQSQWEIPDTQRDGQICVLPNLRIIDARSVSARKLMVRTGVSLLVKAMVPTEVDIYTPGDMPEDVQLYKNEYAVKIPCEAGEKAFVMDEELSFPSGSPKPEKLMRYSLQLEINEKKVMAGKLVFRGSAILQVLYRAEDGLHSFSIDLPFAQYAELENDYDPEASAWVYPALTSLELELGEEDRLRLKAGVTGQYVICDRKQISVVEDAYSTTRELRPQMETMQLPLVLEEQEMNMHAQCTFNGEGHVIDTVFYPDHPRQSKNAEALENQLSGRFQLLYYDYEGILRGGSCKWEDVMPIRADENSTVEMYLYPSGQPRPDGIDLKAETVTTAGQGMEAVAALTLGDAAVKDPNRPSLILRKSGNETLWQLAKNTGSTIADIQKANNLEAEPEPGRILLIPVS